MTAGAGARIDYSSPDWQETLLQTRARILAGQGVEAGGGQTFMRALVVASGALTFAFPVVDVLQVLPWRSPVRLPGGRSALDGRSGSYFHIYGLPGLLGLGSETPPGGHVIRLRAFGGSVAVHVSRALGVDDIAIEPGEASVSLPGAHPAASALGRTADGQVIRILDAERLFRPASQPQFEVE
jgi:chemotaxis protein histidine kinase CheA